MVRQGVCKIIDNKSGVVRYDRTVRKPVNLKTQYRSDKRLYGKVKKICDAFRNEYMPVEADRKIFELRRLSNLVVAPVKIEIYKKLRKVKHRVGLKRCFVCSEWADFYHHIISLINGGINAKVNLLPICERCHNEIHPWLKK